MSLNQPKTDQKSKFPIFGSLVTAILASICCLGPIVLAVLGVGGAGLFSKFERLRPYLFGLTAIFLGLAFHFTYRKRRVECDDGTCKIHKAPKWNKISLWIATTLVVLFLALPFLIGLINSSSDSPLNMLDSAEVTIIVKDMTCSGCEFNLETSIKKLDGITKVNANYKKGKILVLFRKGQVKIEEIMQAVNKAGYTALDYELKESK